MAVDFTTGDSVEELDEIPEDIADWCKTAKSKLEDLRVGTNDHAGVGLIKLKEYLEGKMPGPYLPPNADDQYQILAKRSITNWVRTAVATPAQCMFIEGHRLPQETEMSPAWKIWQQNGMDARQGAIFRTALTYGTALVGVRVARTGAAAGRTRILCWSPLDTVALWEDPVNDLRPTFVFHISRWASDKRVGKIVAVDNESWYDIEYEDDKYTVVDVERHGCIDTPVVAFVPIRDLEGRPTGIIRHLLTVQDRINQTQFDLLLQQLHSSFNINYVTGTEPPDETTVVSYSLGEAIADGRIDEDDPNYAGLPMSTKIGQHVVPVVDPVTGETKKRPIKAGPASMLVVPDAQAKVGSIPATDPTGTLANQEQNIHHFASSAQIPPHYFLGKMDNLSADALVVAESSLFRMTDEFRHSFGESVEQLFQIVAEVAGVPGADIWDAEVVWKDPMQKSLSQTSDALGKWASMLGIPPQALWKFLPGVSQGDLTLFEKLHEEQKAEMAAMPMNGLRRRSSPPDYRDPSLAFSAV